tara:strand:+ start:11 stop:211 length:201 start_codon:yes stop_codon:yes gene_type:complete
MDMARDDGKRYGAGGSVMLQEIVEEPPKPVRKSRTKKTTSPAMLEETVRDALPSDVEPMDETEDEK